MTKKHFKLIAENFLQTKPLFNENDNERAQYLYLGKYLQWQNDVIKMANVCNYFNSRFDWSQFLDACGYED